MSSADPKAAERERKLREYRADIERLEAKRTEQGSLTPAERAKMSKRKASIEALESGQAEPRLVHPGPESDTELASMLGMFMGGVVFPILGVFARRFWSGTIGELTAAEELELGTAFVPWARRMPWLVFLARWATAPTKFIRMVKAKFEPFPSVRTPSGISAPAPGSDRTTPQPDRTTPQPALRAVSERTP